MGSQSLSAINSVGCHKLITLCLRCSILTNNSKPPYRVDVRTVHCSAKGGGGGHEKLQSSFQPILSAEDYKAGVLLGEIIKWNLRALIIPAVALTFLVFLHCCDLEGKAWVAPLDQATLRSVDFPSQIGSLLYLSKAGVGGGEEDTHPVRSKQSWLSG